jgi:transcriptional regulator with XRE-family HTH domain
MYVSVIGQRLKSIREGKGLSLREFGGLLEEDHTLLYRIETGHRYPPKSSVKQFAKVLSLTEPQLLALVAVERRGLDPYEFLPEIPPPYISNESIEKVAEGVLRKFCRSTSCSDIDLPVPVDKVLKIACGLSTQYCDFQKEKIGERHLYGCLYPDGFRGLDRAIFVNTGVIPRRRCRLSPEERCTTAAHEAGHYMLHCGNRESAQLFFRFSKGPSFCRDAECEDSLFDPREYQASTFAACLLMPRTHFQNVWKKAEGRSSELAGAFGVTESFVRFRAKGLEL